MNPTKPQTNPAPRKRDSQATRHKLLTTAERLFVEKGFDAARIDEIADQAGVNKRMLYVYFGNKEQVYAEVLRHNFERLLSLGQSIVDTRLTPAQQAEVAVRRYFRFVADNPNYVRLLGWESLSDRSIPFLSQFLSAGLHEVQSVLQKGVQAGAFRKDLEVSKLLMSINALCVTYFSRRALLEALWKVDFDNPAVQEELLNHIVALVLHGILAEPSEASGAPCGRPAKSKRSRKGERSENRSPTEGSRK